MEFAVHRNGESVGTVIVTEQGSQVYFEVTCSLLTTAVLRCYGLRAPAPPLLIGIPEPQQNKLYFRKKLSKQSIGGILPTVYVLLDASQEIPTTIVPIAEEPPSACAFHTGDALLDRLLLDSSLQVRQQDTHLHISCPFDTQKPLPLSPVAVLCQLEQIENQWYVFLEIEQQNLTP